MKTIFNKNFFAVLFILIFSGITNAYGFTDIDTSDLDYDIISNFNRLDIAKGYPDGSFRPDKTVSRAEFLTFANRAFGFKDSNKDIEFIDVVGDEWFSDDLEIAVERGYIRGYPNSTFRPENNINRYECAVIFDNIMDKPPLRYERTSDEIEIWAVESVNAMVSRGVMDLIEGAFKGEDSATRRSIVICLSRIMEIYELENQAIDKISFTDEEDMLYSLSMAILGLENVLDGGTSYARKLDEKSIRIVSEIKEAMENYLEDDSFNYEEAIDNVKMEELSSLEKNDIEKAIRASVSIEYIGVLRGYFID